MEKKLDKRYLEVISTPVQIHNQPTNDSTAKQLFSFPRSERFPAAYYRPHCAEAFYDIPVSLLRSSRACSLGKGKKFDFTRSVVATPGPNAYTVHNHTVAHNSSQKSSIGIARDAAPQFGILPQNPGQFPGPGAYEPHAVPSQKTIQFRIKLQDKSQFVNPNGPGSYDILKAFEPARPVPLSQYKSVHNVKICPSSSAKLQTQPQPELFYDTKFQMNKTGVFFNSKYKNSRCRSFGKAQRGWGSAKENQPGPGNYRVPSDFGFYESSTFSKTDSSRKAKGNKEK